MLNTAFPLIFVHLHLLIYLCLTMPKLPSLNWIYLDNLCGWTCILTDIDILISESSYVWCNGTNIDLYSKKHKGTRVKGSEFIYVISRFFNSIPCWRGVKSKLEHSNFGWLAIVIWRVILPNIWTLCTCVGYGKEDAPTPVWGPLINKDSRCFF